MPERNAVNSNIMYRALRNGIGVILACGLSLDAARRVEIDYDYVVNEARELSEEDYRPSENGLPRAVREMDYDVYRTIVFRDEESLWRRDGLSWALQFFHPGYIFQDPMELIEFSGDHAQSIRFVSDWFQYGERAAEVKESVSSRLGYAGFRINYPLNNGTKFDEVVSFLGASYFRMLGKGQSYGLSARGIAINTNEPSGEEFPRFVRIWLGRPDFGDESVRFYALLDGRSLTGAFQFTLTPGEETLCEVIATVFLREKVERLGFAPFSSMFYFGEINSTKPSDYRPEVHDSDGLLIADRGGERIRWRPLRNEGAIRDTSFPVEHLDGFGLMQRDRNFDHYQDLEARYEKRPSAWVEPVGEWPPGTVELVELPSSNEMADNIVSFWEPMDYPEPRDAFSLSYRLHWLNNRVSPLGKVVATRQGRNINVEGRRSVMIDFAEFPEGVTSAGVVPKAKVEASGGVVVVHTQVMRNEYTKGFRVAIDARDDTELGADAMIRCRLWMGDDPVSEEWIFPWKSR